MLFKIHLLYRQVQKGWYDLQRLNSTTVCCLFPRELEKNYGLIQTLSLKSSGSDGQGKRPENKGPTCVCPRVSRFRNPKLQYSWPKRERGRAVALVPSGPHRIRRCPPTLVRADLLTPSTDSMLFSSKNSLSDSPRISVWSEILASHFTMKLTHKFNPHRVSKQNATK